MEKFITDFSRKKVLLLAIGHLITDIYPGFLAPVLPLLMVKLRFNVARAAILSSTLSISTSLLQPFFGYLSDKIRRTFLIIIGPLTASIIMSSIDFPNNYYLLLLFVFFGGLGVSAFHPQAAALINIKSGVRKNSGMSIFVFGGSIGIGVGALLISTVVAIGGLKSIYYAVLPGIIISLFLYKSFSKEKITEVTENNNLTLYGASFVLIILIITAIIRAFIILGLSTFIPIYLAEKGRNVAYGGITLFLMHSSGALGGLIGGHISEKIGEKLVILLSFAIPIPVFYLYLISDGLISLIFITIGAFFLYSAIPVVIFLGQNTFPNKISTISSMMMGFCWGTASIILIGMGAIAEIIGVKTTLFYLITSAGLGVLFASLLLKFNIGIPKN